MTTPMHPRTVQSKVTVKRPGNQACRLTFHSPHPQCVSRLHAHSKTLSKRTSTPTFFLARYLRTYFCNVMAAAWTRAWRAALAAAFLPAAVVRLKRVRTSHMRTQLCTTVALRFLHPASTHSCIAVTVKKITCVCEACMSMCVMQRCMCSHTCMVFVCARYAWPCAQRRAALQSHLEVTCICAACMAMCTKQSCIAITLLYMCSMHGHVHDAKPAVAKAQPVGHPDMRCKRWGITVWRRTHVEASRLCTSVSNMGVAP